MDAVRRFVWGPTPEEQKRKCNSILRSNVRKLDRDIQDLKRAENQAKDLIRQASKRAQRNPAHAKQAQAQTRIFAKELIKARKQTGRLLTSRAQLESVQRQVNEAFSIRKIEGSLKASTGIMKEVNTLVKLPELTSTMRELSQELVKAGIIEEMTEDMLPGTEMMEDEDEEVEAEVDKVLGEVLRGRTPAQGLPQKPEKEEELPSATEQEEEDEEEADMLDQMRGRLEALKS